MARVVWSSSAAADLEEIINWMADHHSNQTAGSFIDRIDTEITRLPGYPESGRIIPELERQNIPKYREIIISPWRVFYMVENDRVAILAVIDGRRNVEDIILRRNIR